MVERASDSRIRRPLHRFAVNPAFAGWGRSGCCRHADLSACRRHGGEHGASPARRHATQATVAGACAERVAYLDRLKVVLVAVIIASHGALG